MLRIFRGKDVLTKQWVYGDLMHINGGCALFTGDHEHARETKHEDIAVSFSHEEISVVYANTVGQYTGLHDSEGKDIYEGDVIVGKYGHLHVILYNESFGAYTATLLDENLHNDLKTECCVTQRWISETGKRVTGNIYDTPEFLK